MKILAIGDFHGTFPRKFYTLIKKEKIDLVVSNGDFFPFIYRDLWFKHCYRTKKELWEVIGKKRYRSLVKKDLKLGERALRALNDLDIPIFTVIGNIDHIEERYNDQYDRRVWRKSKWAWAEEDRFTPLLKKYSNIKRFDYSFIERRDYVFIGARGGTSPGMVMSSAYRAHKKLLDNLFRRFKNKRIIFVSHNVPYNTKLDRIGSHAHEAVRGKHYGSKLIRRVIDRWQPLIHIGGHIHEGRGKQLLGKTLCVNPGAAHEGHAAIISLEGKKARIRFV